MLFFFLSLPAGLGVVGVQGGVNVEEWHTMYRETSEKKKKKKKKDEKGRGMIAWCFLPPLSVPCSLYLAFLRLSFFCGGFFVYWSCGGWRAGATWGNNYQYWRGTGGRGKIGGGAMSDFFIHG